MEWNQAHLTDTPFDAWTYAGDIEGDIAGDVEGGVVRA